MQTLTFSAQIPKTTLTQAEAFFEQGGLNLETAVVNYLETVVNKGAWQKMVRTKIAEAKADPKNISQQKMLQLLDQHTNAVISSLHVSG